MSEIIIAQIGATVISLGGVGLACWLIWLLSNDDRTALIDVDLAGHELAMAYPDFHPAEWLFDEPQRRAAIAIDTTQTEIAIIFSFGRGCAVRRRWISETNMTLEGGRLWINLLDLVTPNIELAAISVGNVVAQQALWKQSQSARAAMMHSGRGTRAIA
jgi:hypothetical protein